MKPCSGHYLPFKVISFQRRGLCCQLAPGSNKTFFRKEQTDAERGQSAKQLSQDAGFGAHGLEENSKGKYHQDTPVAPALLHTAPVFLYSLSEDTTDTKHKYGRVVIKPRMPLVFCTHTLPFLR